MRYSVALTLVAISALSEAGDTSAQVPDRLSFQGVITDGLGAPIDTTVEMTFKLYKNSIAVWTETHPFVQVNGGRFDVVLGSIATLDTVGTNQLIEVGVTVGADPEILPRTPLSSTPYALSLRGLRVEPTASVNGPNLIGGSDANSAGSDVEGATISGGGSANEPNVVDNLYGTIGGGIGNLVTGASGTIGGGAYNQVEGQDAVVAGGALNTAAGTYSTVSGGYFNSAGGVGSQAGGFRAVAEHEGSFVWSDRSDTTADFSSTGPNQFVVRADGGVGVGTDSPQQALDVEGSARVSEHFKYSSTRTYHYHIPAAGLHPLRFFEFFDGQSQDPYWHIFGTYLYLLNGIGDTTLTFGGPVNLPDSVTVTAFNLHYVDDDAANDIAYSASLCVRPVASADAFCEPVATAGLITSGASSSLQTDIGSVGQSLKLIQNAANMYWVEVRITRLSPNDFSSFLRLYGLTIEYTSDRINF